MDAFLTILIWLGSGFAFAVGVCLGIWLTARSMRDTHKQDLLNARSIELLEERNKIGKRQAEAMERLGDVTEGR
jgi:uncharacterized protein YneF (UPF0154 family)